MSHACKCRVYIHISMDMRARLCVCESVCEAVLKEMKDILMTWTAASGGGLLRLINIDVIIFFFFFACVCMKNTSTA